MFPEGKALSGEASPDRGEGEKPAPRRRADCQLALRGRCGIFSGPLADWHGRFSTFTGRLTGLADDVMGRKQAASST
ncbi:hypothetical protein NXC14_PA00186 (plasmid) [Rhizobium sp. NXC14]|nr:hypothetical protein NXC14_PA00186 [Rhizobium sp. NXC14]